MTHDIGRSHFGRTLHFMWCLWFKANCRNHNHSCELCHSELSWTADANPKNRNLSFQVISHPTLCILYMAVSKNRGILPPKWMVKIMEHPMNKWMIWGVLPPLFFEGHPHIHSQPLATLEIHQLLRPKSGAKLG